MTVIDLNAAFKSLFNVTAFINETQVPIYDKCNFIYKSLIVLQVCTFKLYQVKRVI